jgi:DNA repair protein RadA
MVTADYFQTKYKTLEDIPGLGPAIVKQLREVGLHTVEGLATATVGEVTASGIGEATAAKIIEAARRTMALTYITAEELAERRKEMRRLTTGCGSLDAMLDGGLETQSITEFYGEYGAGKSQICQQLCVTVQLPEERGGLGGGALYIDTEEVFRPDRIIQMAPRLGLDPGEALKRIIFAEAITSSHQMILLENADEVIKENGIRLIVVDSLTGNFRSEYMGREMLAPRQQQLNKHMHKLLRLARAFNAVAAVTNQVLATPDAYAGFHPVPVGGHIVGHRSHTRIYLRKGRSNLRVASIVASPFLPEREAPLRITERGIEYTEEKPQEVKP